MRVHYFTRDRVPWWFGISLYVVLVVLACTCIPQIWSPVSPQCCLYAWCNELWHHLEQHAGFSRMSGT